MSAIARMPAAPAPRTVGKHVVTISVSGSAIFQNSGALDRDQGISGISESYKVKLR
jgi:hypothetical protein